MSTTASQHADPKHVVAVLEKCLEICTDGEKGYAAAAADVRSPALKVLLERRSKERAEFVVALQEAIHELGGFGKHRGTLKGAAHRAWMGMRVGCEHRHDGLIIEEWARGEREALRAYQRAVMRAPVDTLPSDLRALIYRQYVAIQAGLDEARRQLAKLD